MSDDLICKRCGHDVPKRRHRSMTCTSACYEEGRQELAADARLERIVSRQPLLPGFNRDTWKASMRGEIRLT